MSTGVQMFQYRASVLVMNALFFQLLPALNITAHVNLVLEALGCSIACQRIGRVVEGSVGSFDSTTLNQMESRNFGLGAVVSP